MSGNYLMHPRNIYKKPPNFRELALVYPEFRKYVKQDLSGRVSIDFRDRSALRELTRTLLLNDFKLNVEITETKLIPTLPLRLNYILWLEDLLASAVISGQITGIDIGTGASCVYPLLAASRGWNMLATETDPVNYDMAIKNIENNGLSDKISVKLVTETNQVLVDVIQPNVSYDFCMCNPPFFQINEVPTNRTGKRPPPKNAATGTDNELFTEGGEIEFVKKIIDDSVNLQDKIKIYTTMIGKKRDLEVLINELCKINPKSYASTEFCQGRTRRWSLAWTFLDYRLDKTCAPVKAEPISKKTQPPLQLHICECSTGNELKEASDKIEGILKLLQVTYKKEQIEDTTIAFTAKAYTDTWSHQRRKKRKAKFAGVESTKVEPAESAGPKQDNGEPSNKKTKLDTNEKPLPLLLECLLVVKQSDNAVYLAMSWLDGSLGKQGLYQLFQYFVNQLSSKTKAAQ